MHGRRECRWGKLGCRQTYCRESHWEGIFIGTVYTRIHSAHRIRNDKSTSSRWADLRSTLNKAWVRIGSSTLSDRQPRRVRNLTGRQEKGTYEEGDLRNKTLLRPKEMPIIGSTMTEFKSANQGYQVTRGGSKILTKAAWRLIRRVISQRRISILLRPVRGLRYCRERSRCIINQVDS